MTKPMLIAKNSMNIEFHLLPRMANRHGLVAGATGTGKTVTLQRIAECLSENGVPVFLADVKGDLAGVSQKGTEQPKIMERIKLLGLSDHCFQPFPAAFWDVFGQSGHPIRTTVSDMGPLLMGRLLDLNKVQTGVLNLIFKLADDNGLLLLDLKDLRSMVQYAGENASQFTTEYGNISKASVGAIQRGLLELDTQCGSQFFWEPMLDIFHLIQTHSDGRGVINILAADQLINRPKVYATFLLWLLAELYERLPEAGDLEKPRMVFFFDEAHFLFEDAPEALLPIDPATEAVSPAYVPPPADPSPHEPLREGDWITRRTGRLAATDDGRRRFEFDDAPEQRPLPAMIVLPNGLLEAMERHGPETLFDVSGEVTRYRDDVFLVIRRAVVVSGGDQEG